MSRYPRPMAHLIEELTRLPGIGPKTAQRLSFFMIGLPEEDIRSLSSAIVNAKERTKLCSKCFQLTEDDPCLICTDARRDQSMMCVVEEPRDVFAIERTKQFHGLYHVLHGAISPLEGIGPEQLHIKELITRLGEEVNEVLIATDPNVEGEATAMYLGRLIKPMGIKVTRMAHGMPVGSDMEYVDEVTLSKALEGRREL